MYHASSGRLSGHICRTSSQNLAICDWLIAGACNKGNVDKKRKEICPKNISQIALQQREITEITA
jgi:hypothetical protein